MTDQSSFFKILNLENTKKGLNAFSEKTGIPVKSLLYYNDNSILPPSNELEAIASLCGINKFQIMIGMGIYDQELKELLSKQAVEISKQLTFEEQITQENHQLVYENDFGRLYQGDCISLMKSMENNSVDLVFADPPFNLSKAYASKMDDNVPTSEYIKWTEKWLNECIRILKPGGSMFFWNLPKWNTYFSEFLNHRLTFKHWIAADLKYSLPIQSKLYPSHYSLLYYVKEEKALTFTPDRLRMDTCPHCYRELRDYGGYKNKMNPLGINMSDVWYDIPPVRHSKHKKRKEANELSIKLMDRVIQMASKEGDVVFDPFGGAGTTYVVSELKNRRWVGVELGPTEGIIDRLINKEEETTLLNKHRENYNQLFPAKIKRERIKRDLWTDESFKDKNEN